MEPDTAVIAVIVSILGLAAPFVLGRIAVDASAHARRRRQLASQRHLYIAGGYRR